MDYSDYIIPYLKGNLNGDRLLGFENHLKQNPEFAEEVAFQKDLMDSLVYMKEDADLRAMSNKIREKDDQREKIKRLVPAGALSLAAVLAIFFLIVAPNFNNQPYQQTFSDHFQPAEMNSVVLGSQELVSAGNETPKEMFENAKIAYSQENYNEAIGAFDKVISSGSYIEQATLYQGIAYLAMDKPKKAIRKFDEMVEYPSHTLWYKGLATLKLGKTGQAKDLMKNLLELESELSDNEKVYSDRAAKILENLEE